MPAVLVVAAGSWWALHGAIPDGSTVRGSAVVVSSLACQNGDEGTVVDLLDPAGQPPGTSRRATLDSCGHQAGEVIAVDYSQADPSRVVPAATAAADGDSTGRGLMLGIVLAAVLGAVAVVAVIRDGRRRQAFADGAAAHPDVAERHGRHARVDDDEPPVVPDDPVAALVNPSSDLDLLFPAWDRLAESLHDELFTHRTPAGV